MSTNKPPSDTVLARATELRAGGCSWEVVAKALHRSPETVRRWPRMYPERWQAAIYEAERRVAAEAGSESLLILRELLRSLNATVRWHAARCLLHHRIDLAKLDLRAAQSPSPSAQSDAERLVAFIESHTDEQLAELTAARLGQPATALPPPPPQPEGGAG